MVVVEGFGGSDVSAGPIVTEGFSSTSDQAVAKPPQGFGGSSSGKPVKVEGFGGGSEAVSGPPPEGFGDSGDSRGLSGGGAGFLDQEEEWDNAPPEEVDIGPGGEVEEAESDEEPEQFDRGPDWQESDEGDSGQDENKSMGEESGDSGDPKEQKKLESVVKNAGKSRFTAQLRAVGQGGFHEWRMNFLKTLVEGKHQLPK